MVNKMKDYSFIQVGKPAIPIGKKEVVYIVEILGDKVITTNGSYKKEQLSSIFEIAKLLKFIEGIQN